MIQAMYSGVSGLRAFKSQLDVIGNNIANLNTTGYKSARVTFRDMMSQTVSAGSSPGQGVGGTNPTQVGLGVSVASIDTDTSQGSLQATGRMTDIAIEGSGYLMVGDGSNRYYTRDGAFTLDADYNLVAASSGMKVLGWMPDASGLINTAQAPGADAGIRAPVGTLANAKQTTMVRIGRNLDSGSDVGTEASPNIDVFDSQGTAHRLDITFTKTGTPSQWTYAVFCADVDAGDPTATPPVLPTPVKTGTMNFDANGKSDTDLVDISLTLATPNGSKTPLLAKVSLGAVTQLAGATTVSASYQDGLRLGTLEGFDIEKDGTIMGTFDNGSKEALGQIALAEFSNSSGLVKAGANMLSEGPNSGIPQVAPPGTGSRGKLTVGFLEASNVDLSSEFANMIVAQRGFQANSRIITVSDEVIQELVQLKR